MTDTVIERLSDLEVRTHEDSECVGVPDLDDICFDHTLFSENVFEHQNFEELCRTESDEETNDRTPHVAIPRRKRKPTSRLTKNSGKNARKAVENDSIQAVFMTACDMKCMDKLTSSDVLGRRRSFWDKDRDEQRQYIMSQLEANFKYHEQDARVIMFTVRGHSVCPKCWRAILAVSKSRYYSALSDVKNGLVTARPDHRTGLCYDTKRFLEAKLWLTRFTRRHPTVVAIGTFCQIAGRKMANINVTGADGNAKVKNSSVVGIQDSGQGRPLPEGISKMEVTGVKGEAQVDNSVVAGINDGQMGPIENRQQTYNIGNAHGVVGGQDMRGPAVNQGGDTEGRWGHKEHFRGKARSDITEKDIEELLREKGLTKYIQLFQTKGIDGDLLSQLTESDLTDFGIDESFERKRILNLVKYLPK